MAGGATHTFGEFMQLNLRFGMGFLAACLVLVGCGKKEEGATKPAATNADVVLIGHVGPTSGAIAHLGQDNENGARLAIEELNAEGVVIGGKKVTLELLA
jgi:branched-chain amino acid transport system substrate-binding protein